MKTWKGTTSGGCLLSNLQEVPLTQSSSIRYTADVRYAGGWIHMKYNDLGKLIGGTFFGPFDLVEVGKCSIFYLYVNPPEHFAPSSPMSSERGSNDYETY